MVYVKLPIWPGENDLEGSRMAGLGGTACRDTREVMNTMSDTCGLVKGDKTN